MGIKRSFTYILNVCGFIAWRSTPYYTRRRRGTCFPTLSSSLCSLAYKRPLPGGGCCRGRGSAGPLGPSGPVVSLLSFSPLHRRSHPRPGNLTAWGRRWHPRIYRPLETQSTDGTERSESRVPQGAVGAFSRSLPPALGRGQDSAHARHLVLSWAGAAGPIRAWELSPPPACIKTDSGAVGGTRLHFGPYKEKPRLSLRARKRRPCAGAFPAQDLPSCTVITASAVACWSRTRR